MGFFIDNVVIQQIFKAKLFDITTNECYAVLNDLKEANVENTADTTYATGGPGNRRIESFDFNKQAKFTMSSATYAMGAFNAQLGIAPVIGANSEYVYTDIFTASTSTAATLTKTPVSAPEFIYTYDSTLGILGDKFSLVESSPGATTYTVSTKAVTFGAGGTLEAADTLVSFYNVASPSTSVTVTNRSDLFGRTMKLVLDGLVRSNGQDYAVQMICDKFKLSSNFNFGTSSSGEASVHNLSGDILATSGLTPRYWQIILLNDTLLV